MLNPSPTFSNEIVAVVSILSAFSPTAPSWPESAIVKHPACAAAINSSGFVPLPFSNRVEKEYCALESVPLSVEIFPLPSFKDPCQTAEALRTIFCFLLVGWMNDRNERTHKLNIKRESCGRNKSRASRRQIGNGRGAHD